MDYPKAIKAFIGESPLKSFNQGQSLATLYQFENDDQAYVLKIQPTSDESHQEATMLDILSKKTLAPKIFISASYEKNHYIIMEKHKDQTLESLMHTKPIDKIIDIALDGLNQLASLNDLKLPRYSLEKRLQDAYYNIKSGYVKRLDETPYTAPYKDPMALYHYLVANMPSETNSFVHGDYCLDNILTDGTKVTGFIDLGRSGMSDIYQDLALLIRELSDYDIDILKKISEKLFPIDQDKLNYYLLLDELF
ncbi:MAG: phosphotransferase [Candidatus Izemoplasmataceae bacterium]